MMKWLTVALVGALTMAASAQDGVEEQLPPGMERLEKKLPQGSDAHEVLDELKRHYQAFLDEEEKITDFPYIATLLRLCMDASQQTPEKALQYFLEIGADVNAPDDELNMTPLVMAAWSDKLGESVFDKLLAAGAEANSRRGLMSPLQASAFLDRHEICRKLLAAGADPRARMGENEETVLHSAAAFGAVRVCVLLLAAGADIEAKDKMGATPLFYAVAADAPAVVRLLIESGADVTVRSALDQTPHDVAKMMERDARILRALEAAQGHKK